MIRTIYWNLIKCIMGIFSKKKCNFEKKQSVADADQLILLVSPKVRTPKFVTFLFFTFSFLTKDTFSHDGCHYDQ